MSTPSITAAQVVSFLVAILGAAAIVFKLNISDAEMAKYVGIITAVVVAAWPVADAIIRHGRSTSVAAAHNLAAAQIQSAPDAVDRAPAA